MPTQNRRDYIRLRTKKEFRDSRKLINQDDIRDALVHARDSLDTIRAQRKHLTKIIQTE